MIENDVRVSLTGEVTGTIKYIEGYHEFWEGRPDMQEGNYFPFRILKEGSTVTVKKNGGQDKGGETKTVEYDPKWVLRIGEKTDKFEFLVDNESIITLDFSKATLKSK